MLPIGPLMVEHRLIERMIRTMEAELQNIQRENRADPGRVEKIVYFIQSYADHCHHGKEENILFRELGRKQITPAHRKIMEELIEDHKLGRKITLSISEANRRYQEGDAAALSAVAQGFRSLVDFYPKHIEKEDQGFFIPVMSYFDQAELEAMIREGYRTDSTLLHLDHENLVAEMSAGRPAAPKKAQGRKRG
jgi:hemerythrin-like domain-containing protein